MRDHLEERGVFYLVNGAGKGVVLLAICSMFLLRVEQASFGDNRLFSLCYLLLCAPPEEERSRRGKRGECAKEGERASVRVCSVPIELSVAVYDLISSRFASSARAVRVVANAMARMVDFILARAASLWDGTGGRSQSREQWAVLLAHVLRVRSETKLVEIFDRRVDGALVEQQTLLKDFLHSGGYTRKQGVSDGEKESKVYQT